MLPLYAGTTVKRGGSVATFTERMAGKSPAVTVSRLSNNWAPTSRSARRPRFLLFNQRPIGRVAAVERQRCEHRPHPRLRGRRRAPARSFTTSGFGVFRRCNLQTTVPKSFPIPAVRAIANVPQNVTRAVARRTFAPPAHPPIAPRRAKKPKEAAATIGTSAAAGDTTTISKGMAAPTENDKADVNAA